MRLKAGIIFHVQKSLSYHSIRMTIWDLLMMEMPSASHKHIQRLSNTLSMPNWCFTGSFQHIIGLCSFYICIRHIIPYKVPESRWSNHLKHDNKFQSCEPWTFKVGMLLYKVYFRNTLFWLSSRNQIVRS